MRKQISGLLCLALLCAALSGCSAQATMSSQTQSTLKEADLMTGVSAGAVVTTDAAFSSDAAGAMADFSVRLLQQTAGAEENTLISPLSVLLALGMTANGSSGETLTQLEAALGMPSEKLNESLYAYVQSLSAGADNQLHGANSIWFRQQEGLTVEPAFLQANAAWYGAEIYAAAFDQSTCSAINDWVRSNTGGLIGQILDQFPDGAMLCLINALAFEAQWETPYESNQIQTGTFTTETGETRLVRTLRSEEAYYLEDGGAVGVVKPYAGGDYAFAALLPEEVVSLADYVASLTGQRLLEILDNTQKETVHAVIPAFEAEYTADLKQALQAMGVTDAFDSSLADLSAMGSSTGGNLYISSVLHKTYLSLDESGTKAGAATTVVVEESAALAAPKTVCLDRPFVYMIVDCQHNLPVFLGVVTDLPDT